MKNLHKDKVYKELLLETFDVLEKNGKMDSLLKRDKNDFSQPNGYANLFILYFETLLDKIRLRLGSHLRPIEKIDEEDEKSKKLIREDSNEDYDNGGYYNTNTNLNEEYEYQGLLVKLFEDFKMKKLNHIYKLSFNGLYQTAIVDADVKFNVMNLKMILKAVIELRKDLKRELFKLKTSKDYNETRDSVELAKLEYRVLFLKIFINYLYGMVDNGVSPIKSNRKDFKRTIRNHSKKIMGVVTSVLLELDYLIIHYDIDEIMFGYKLEDNLGLVEIDEKILKHRFKEIEDKVKERLLEEFKDSILYEEPIELEKFDAVYFVGPKKYIEIKKSDDVKFNGIPEFSCGKARKKELKNKEKRVLGEMFPTVFPHFLI